jgi:hypothetical protein
MNTRANSGGANTSRYSASAPSGKAKQPQPFAAAVMFKTDNIQPPSERLLCSVKSAYSERLIPPLIKEETQLPSSDLGGGTDIQTQR